jgi:hypothetical protein
MKNVNANDPVANRPGRSPPDSRELLAIIRRIAATPLWGEAMEPGPERDDYAAVGEYDLSRREFNPSCDTESSQLRDVVELARLALIRADPG